MEIKDLVNKIYDISPRIKDVKLTELQHEVYGDIDDKPWIQIEPSGEWKVEFVIGDVSEDEDPKGLRIGHRISYWHYQ